MARSMKVDLAAKGFGLIDVSEVFWNASEVIKDRRCLQKLNVSSFKMGEEV